MNLFNLHKSIFYGDIQLLQMALEDGADLNIKYSPSPEDIINISNDINVREEFKSIYQYGANLNAFEAATQRIATVYGCGIIYDRKIPHSQELVIQKLIDIGTNNLSSDFIKLFNEGAVESAMYMYYKYNFKNFSKEIIPECLKGPGLGIFKPYVCSKIISIKDQKEEKLSTKLSVVKYFKQILNTIKNLKLKINDTNLESYQVKSEDIEPSHKEFKNAYFNAIQVAIEGHGENFLTSSLALCKDFKTQENLSLPIDVLGIIGEYAAFNHLVNVNE